MNFNTTTTASARVKVELEIAVGSKWGADCSIEQIHKQAENEAVGIIRHLCEQAQERRVTIIGTPNISAVIVNKLKG